jgi:hypothetical protein
MTADDARFLPVSGSRHALLCVGSWSLPLACLTPERPSTLNAGRSRSICAPRKGFEIEHVEQLTSERRCDGCEQAILHTLAAHDPRPSVF